MIVSLLFRYECYDWDIYMKIIYVLDIHVYTIAQIQNIYNSGVYTWVCHYISEYIADVNTVHFWIQCQVYTWNCPPYRKLDENLALGCDCYLYETLLVVQTTISGGQCGTPASVQGVLFGYVNKTSPMYFENQKLTNFLCCEWFYYYQYM